MGGSRNCCFAFFKLLAMVGEERCVPLPRPVTEEAGKFCRLRMDRGGSWLEDGGLWLEDGGSWLEDGGIFKLGRGLTWVLSDALRTDCVEMKSDTDKQNVLRLQNVAEEVRKETYQKSHSPSPNHYPYPLLH